MEICWNPISFVMNACLLLHPSLELSLGTKPVDPINYSFFQWGSNATVFIDTYIHPSMSHRGQQLLRNSKSMEAGYCVVRPAPHPEWQYLHGDPQSGAVATVAHPHMHAGFFYMHLSPCCNVRHVDAQWSRHYEWRPKHESLCVVFWHVGPGRGKERT
jgi:hypothetical protein